MLVAGKVLQPRQQAFHLLRRRRIGRDPEFFDFYRSLEAYRESFNPEDTTMVLSPEGDFFRYFGDITGGAGTLPPVVDQADRPAL